MNFDCATQITLYMFKNKYQITLPSSTTTHELEQIIYENFQETLPFMVTHRMKILAGGRDILLRKESIQEALRDSNKVLSVEFEVLQEKTLECSFMAEANIISQAELTLSSIREESSDDIVYMSELVF